MHCKFRYASSKETNYIVDYGSILFLSHSLLILLFTTLKVQIIAATEPAAAGASTATGTWEGVSASCAVAGVVGHSLVWKQT